MAKMIRPPGKTGLYDPRNEHDACGIGAVVNISGERSHEIVQQGRRILENLMHRGAAGSDENTGDGAGILMQIPHDFLAEVLSADGISLPDLGHYGVGMLFFPQDPALNTNCMSRVEASLKHYGMDVLGWRDVPTDSDGLGEVAKQSEPIIKQVFFSAGKVVGEDLEQKLLLARKRAEKAVATAFGEDAAEFYICSLSSRTICYKGMFLAPQLFNYFTDLQDERFVSALAIVHQRYSTNTFPSWKLAQPFRMLAHNGEINTLSGNINRIAAHERLIQDSGSGEDLSDLCPVLSPGQSDSASFDNVLELLTRTGRSAPHAMMMMVPEAFGSAYHISTDKRAFYEYHAAIMEPWDGPAAMVFTDGNLVGGTLDRNGLRPCRYVVTTDGLVVMASEVGVIDLPPERIQSKGRLQPGKMFLVDTIEGRIITDNEIKSRIARQKPYRRWLEQNRIELQGLFTPLAEREVDPAVVEHQLRLFGYTREELNMILLPMAKDGQEPIGSMGNDAPLAILSERPKLIFNYFKQLFAQVTNPPIDPYREGLVMSLMGFTGKQRNLLAETPEHCRQLKLPHPILSNDDMERLRASRLKDFKVTTIPALFEAGAENPSDALSKGVDQMLIRIEEAITDGASLIIISDRGASEELAPIPSLIAAGAAHHGLLQRDLRAEVGLVIESGEPREVMHFCLLCGFGMTAVNPYLALDALDELQRRGELPADMSRQDMIDNYVVAVKKGILKTMSKMGISTLRSYRGAQLFEAIGLGSDVVDRYFCGVASRIGGADLGVIAEETLRRHRKAFAELEPGELSLDFGGDYHFRHDGEKHGWDPDTLSLLQFAARTNDWDKYEKFAELVNDQSRRLLTLRGLFEFVPGESVPLDEVEPATEITKRFCTGAMSHGSVSKEVHESLAAGMNMVGGMSNTGEGGEDPARYEKREDGYDLNSAIKQVASGRFGVTMNYLAHARELQIKMAQGAKPGEGGQLPGHKVTDEIAGLRHSTPGVTLISPPPHHDIYSIEDLAQLIFDLKCSNPGVKVSVKLVSEVGVGTIAAGVAKGNADEVLISGHDGGTGASPLTSIKHTGGPWELGLAETQQTLVLNGLRDRVRVQADGTLKTGRDVVVAALLGAEQFGFGTAAIITQGCIMMRKCHKGTCPVGVATQDPELRKKFTGKPEHIANYMMFIAEDVRRIMAELGFRKLDDMVGQVQRLQTNKAMELWKGRNIDLSLIFAVPDTSNGSGLYRAREQADTISSHLDWQIIEQLGDAIESGTATDLNLPIRNIDRTIGTILSNRVVRHHGPDGLADNTLNLNFTGSAGQSFGAFLAKGITLSLTGDANDYLGKGLSGGRIVVKTPPGSPFIPHENIIVGNTLLYGATSGEVFINGLAGERFCVRNSGATAVVEGVGDHGCEYMTNGTVVIIGQTGRNFAAGMSGGVAYVLDEHQFFDTRCNLDMVDLESVWQTDDVALLGDLLKQHCELTGSERAQYILDKWRNMIGSFVKVMPIDYRAALQRMKQQEMRQSDMTPATEEVFS